MKERPYPEELLSEDDDDGTMPANVDCLREAVVGHRIVSAVTTTAPKSLSWSQDKALILTLDDGTQVWLVDSDDCCAYTALKGFFLNPAAVDHIITGVGTTDGYEKWHIYADFGDVMTLNVGWSCGNPFYYGYGFNIQVVRADELGIAA